MNEIELTSVLTNDKDEHAGLLGVQNKIHEEVNFTNYQ